MEKRKLPNATAVLILGILSIPTCICYGITGIILGVIALILAKRDTKLYNENPEVYSNYSNLSIGKVFAIIGIIVSTIMFVFYMYLLSLGEEGLKEFIENLDAKVKYQQEQSN